MDKVQANPPGGAGRGTVDFGNGFVADFTDLIDAPVELPEPEEGNAGEATPEGEEKAAEPATAEPASEPEKPSDPKEPVAEPEVKPTEPETYEFKIKYRGEELTEKLTKEQLIARVQMAKDYTVKTEELSREKREIEAVKKLAETPWFKEQYEEAIRTGAIESPPAPPPPEPEDVYEYGRRQRDTDFDEVRAAMREYALALPEVEQKILESNHRVFNREYDRFAALVRKDKEPSKPAEVATKVDPAVAKKILQSKEVAKAQAVVEKPGVGSPDADPNADTRKRIAAIRREAKDGKPGAIQQLAYLHMYGELPDF